MRTHEYCDECGEELQAEFVDIGIGWQQVSEATCPNDCGLIEWYYEEYAKESDDPLSFEEWLKMQEVKEERQ